MRISYLTSLAFAGAVFAAPAIQVPAAEITDISEVLGGYKVVLNNSRKLIEKVAALQPGDDVIAVLKSMSALSGNIIATSQNMTTLIRAQEGKLSTAAVNQVAKPSADVATTTVAIVNSLVAKKDLFVQAGVHKLVLEDLNKVYKTANAYVTAAKAKIPDQYATVANRYFGQLLDALQLGIKNFS